MRKHVFFKIYILVIFSVGLLFGVGFAFEDDCLLSTSLISSGTWEPYSIAYPYENLSLAANHLYAYCCKEHLFAQKDKIDCSIAPKEVTLESKYMIEHLVDVGLRALDLSFAYSGQIVDSGAKAWYNVLHPTGDKLALTPLMVETQYKNHWSVTHMPLLQDEAGDIKNYLPLYSGFSLRDKYYNLCYLAKNIYEKVLQPSPTNWALLIQDQRDPKSYYSNCVALSNQKISTELTLTQTLMIQGSSSTLKNTMQTYLTVNFLQDGFQTLLSKLQSVVALFQKIVRQAPVSKRCAQ